MAQFVVNAQRSDPYKNFKFRVKWDGRYVAGGRPEGGQQGKSIHLFLYRALPDPAQYNHDLPSRAFDGALRQRPVIPLNLHYLLTFQGDDAGLDAHKMLGAVARDLHAHPVLSRDLILSVSNGNIAGTNLGDSPEPVRVTFLPLTMEDLSTIWQMFSQIPYSLSVAYEARVVLIEAEEAPAAVLPVLSRGEDERGPVAEVGPFPLLDDYEITLPGAPLQGSRLPSYPSAQLGLQVAFAGRNLGGDTVTVRFSHPRMEALDIVVPPTDRTPDQVRVVLRRSASPASRDLPCSIHNRHSSIYCSRAEPTKRCFRPPAATTGFRRRRSRRRPV